jgi:hypothetical protein
MVKDSDNIGLADATCLKVLHVILASESDSFSFAHRIDERLLSLWVCCQINHVSDQDADRCLTRLTFLNPLLHFLEATAFGNVKHEDSRSAAIDVLIDVLVVSFFAWKIEVNDFVLVGVVYVVRCLDMQFC